MYMWHGVVSKYSDYEEQSKQFLQLRVKDKLLSYHYKSH